MTVVLVCGGRDFAVPNKDDMALYQLQTLYFQSRMQMMFDQKLPDLIIHGNAKGPDMLAGEFALLQQCNVYAVPAKWDLHGKKAGPIRNKEMLDLVHVDLVVAFPGGIGTANMIKQATDRGIKVVDLKEDYQEWLDKKISQ